MNNARPSLGPLAAGVILLAVAAAAIHLYLAPEEFRKDLTKFGVLFVALGLGYLTMLAVAYLPGSFLSPFRGAARVGLVLLALASIIAYFVVGVFETLGWITKIVEAALILAVIAQGATARGAGASEPKTAR